MMEQGTFPHVTDSSRNEKLSLSLVKLKPVLIMGFQTLMSPYNLLTISLKTRTVAWPFKFLDMTFGEGEQENHL